MSVGDGPPRRIAAASLPHSPSGCCGDKPFLTQHRQLPFRVERGKHSRADAHAYRQAGATQHLWPPAPSQRLLRHPTHLVFPPPGQWSRAPASYRSLLIRFARPGTRSVAEPLFFGLAPPRRALQYTMTAMPGGEGAPGSAPGCAVLTPARPPHSAFLPLDQWAHAPALCHSILVHLSSLVTRSVATPFIGLKGRLLIATPVSTQ